MRAVYIPYITMYAHRKNLNSRLETYLLETVKAIGHFNGVKNRLT